MADSIAPSVSQPHEGEPPGATEGGASTDTRADAKPDTNDHTEAGARADAEAGPRTHTEAGPRTHTEAGPRTHTEAGARTHTEAGARAGAGADTGAEIDDVRGTAASAGDDPDAAPGEGVLATVPTRAAEAENGSGGGSPMPQADATPYGLPGKPLARGPFMFGLTAALGVLTALGLAQALVSARSVIVLILVAMFLAVGLNPIVEALQRRRMPRRVAISIVFVAVITFFVLFGLAIVPPVTQEMTEFVQAIPGYVNELSGNETIKRLDADYQLLAKLRDYVTSGDLGATIAGGIVGAGAVVLNGIFSGFTLLVLTLYFLGSLPAIKEYLLGIVPATRRPRTRAMTDEVLTGIGGYVAGNVLISVIAGVLTWLFLAIAGAEYALALALVVAVTDLIPLVGATIGAVFVTGVVLLQSLPLGIASGIFFLIYQQVENYWLYPRVMKRSVDVTPAVTVIAALFGGTLMGIVGALIAIPVAAAVALIIREVVLPRQATL